MVLSRLRFETADNIAAIKVVPGGSELARSDSRSSVYKKLVYIVVDEIGLRDIGNN